MNAGKVLLAIVWTVGVAVLGYFVGQRVAFGHAQSPPPATRPSGGYKYLAIPVTDLLKDVPAPADAPTSPSVGWVALDDPAAAAAANKRRDERNMYLAEAQRRVVNELNRRGEEGWEQGDYCKEAFPYPIPREGVLFFRRPL